MVLYDFIVIGSGPAGLTAAIYAQRRNMKTLVVGEAPGGLVSETSIIENYPGFEKITGMELTDKFINHAKATGAEIVHKEVVKICEKKDVFVVETIDKKYEGKSVLLATGSKHRRIDIPGEKEFSGKGISYCATCDGPLFKDKIVCVLGGSNAAITSASYLSEIASKLYILYRGEKLRAEESTINQLDLKKVEIVYNVTPKEVKGNKFVTSIVMLDTKKNKDVEFKVDGIFVEIGLIPELGLAKGLGVEIQGNMIKVNEKQETSVPGVFAAGDITTNSGFLRQIVTANAEGSVAATYAYMYTRQRDIKLTS